MIYQALTPELREKYLKDITRCPFCQSGNFAGDGTQLIVSGDLKKDSKAHTVTERMECYSCGQRWEDVYRYSRVIAVEQKCEICKKPVTPGQEYRQADSGEDIVHTGCVWEKVSFSAEADEDGNCRLCGQPYEDCPCPGPTQDGYEYEERPDGLYARRL
jgi:hypothetical protein